MSTIALTTWMLAATLVAPASAPAVSTPAEQARMEGSVRYVLSTCPIPAPQHAEAMAMSERFEQTLWTQPGMTKESVRALVNKRAEELEARGQSDPDQKVTACADLPTRCLLIALATRDVGVRAMTGMAAPILKDWPVDSNNECNPSVQLTHPQLTTPAAQRTHRATPSPPVVPSGNDASHRPLPHALPTPASASSQ